MSGEVYLLWFVKEMPEGREDIELLVGVYSSEVEAERAIERVKNEKGFRESPQGFEICPYELDKDHWSEGFVLDNPEEEAPG